MSVGHNGNDFSNGMVHIHGGTVTLPREVRILASRRNQGLTLLGLGTHMRKAADGRKVPCGAKDIHQQRI
jgi:hypothetical protein